MLGFDSLEHLKERNLKESGFVDDLTRSEFINIINKKGLVINFESSWIKKDGTCIQVSENARAIYDDKENIVFYDGVAADITERKTAEKMLKESEERWKALVQDNPNLALQGYDKNGKTIYWNKTSESFYGYSSEEAIGVDLTDLIIPDELKGHVRDAIKEMFTTKTPIPASELKLMCKDGSLLDVFSSHSYFQVPGREPEMYCLDVDISELKQAENALKESEEKARQNNELLRSIMESPKGMIIFSLDPQYRYTSFTISHKEIMKNIWGADIKMGMNILDVIQKGGDRERAKHNFDQALKGEHTILNEEYGADEFRRTSWENRYSPIYSDTNKVVGLTVFVTDITERKQAEVELLNAEEKYRIITQASLDIIFILDKTGKIIFSNNTMATILGYQSNEFLGKSFTHFVPKKELPKYFKKLVDVFMHKEVIDFNTQVYHKDGNLLDVEINGKLIQHEGKLAALGTIRDITERKQAEETLKKSEEEHRFLFENTPNGVIYLNAKGEIVHANKAAEQILGVSITEMQGLKSCDPRWKAIREDGTVYPCEELPAFISLKTGQAIKNAKMCVYNPLCNSDKIININSLPKFKNNETKPYQVVTTFEDITAQKKAERELKESEEKYANAQAIAHLGHWELDIINNELTWSDEIYKIFGFESREFKISYDVFLESVHPDDREMVKAAYSNSLQNKTIYETEHRLLLKSGIVKCVQEKCITKFNDKGEPIRSLGTVLDITKRKKAEQLLKESNAAKDKIFSIIAHDLRSPFNSILGFSELLIENTQDFEVAEIKKYLGIINSSAKSTLVLLDNLLNWARSQTGKVDFIPEEIGLASIIQEIIELSNLSVKSKNISLNYSSLDEIEVYADENMLMVILRNLISNAIKFTNPNGKIDITALQNDNFIEIAVSDNGVGMKEETRKKLFDISANITTRGTANEKGSGLGLILCKEFVAKHGGKIWVESEVGKGSTFYFTLPYQSETIKENGDKNKNHNLENN